MTKKYNKEAAPLPYSQVSVKKGTSTNKDSGIDEFIDPENIDEIEENEDSDMENDAMIKVWITIFFLNILITKFLIFFFSEK